MKKLILLISLFFVLFSCGTKKISPKYEAAVRYFNKYLNLYFEGKFKSAEDIFNKALKEFIISDNMCGASRLYISKYIIYLPEKKSNILNLAGEYASLGDCNREKNIFNFLSGDKFDIKNLEEPYSIYALYEKNKKIDILLNNAENNNLGDYAKSRLYRYAANEFIKANNTVKANETVLKALKIDKFNGWSLLIVKDLRLKLEICEKEGGDCGKLKKRIAVINTGMTKK